MDICAGKIPILDLPMVKSMRPRRLPSVQFTPHSDFPIKADSRSLSSLNQLPARIETRYVTPEGHIMSFRKRRGIGQEGAKDSKERPTPLVDLQPKQIEEEYEVCFAPKELRLRTLSRVYAAHFSVPKPSLSPQHIYPKQTTGKLKCPQSPPKYIFAREPPTGSPVTSHFPVLMQRPMLSTKVIPIKLSPFSKSPDLQRKKVNLTENISESPYHFRYAQEQIRSFRLQSEAKQRRNKSGLVARKAQDTLEQESTVSKSSY